MVYPTNLFPQISLEEIKSYCFVTPNHCWEWQGPKRKGYGALTYNRRTFSVHRISCFLKHGEPNPNDNALHSCDNRSCVNPEHLRWGTQLENVQDAIDRKRWTSNRGTLNGRAKINPDVVRAIRTIWGTGPTIIQIGELYGISNQMVSRIIAKKAWVHVEDR
jgi:hypothetical protein